MFERDGNRCRCCGAPAESMHEILPRGRGGVVSRENSIALCGDGVRGCHGKCQRYEIRIVGDNAEELLVFVPRGIEGLT